MCNDFRLHREGGGGVCSFRSFNYPLVAGQKLESYFPAIQSEMLTFTNPFVMNLYTTL